MSEDDQRRAVLRDALIRIRELQARVDELERARCEPLAIVGMSCRLPGASSPHEFWDLLKDGTDAVRRADPRHGTGWMGALDAVDGFDAGFFGVSAAEAEHMDPQQRLALELTWEALENGGQVLDASGTRAGVFMGVYQNDYLLLQVGGEGGATRVNTFTAPGSAHSILANRLSYTFNLRGPSVAIDTACSSSMVAVHLACQSLRNNECDMAIAGGLNLILSPLSTVITGKVLPLAADGHCKAFDARGDGIVRGEGGGVLVLKRLTDALSAHDPVLALVRGSAVNQDGRSNGLTAPNPVAQSELLASALLQAGVQAASIGYIEAHGTGTALGDPIEVEALASVYGAGHAACALGAVKTNIGHLEAAAGIAGLIKTVLVLQHAETPPTLHLESVNPLLDLDGTRLFIPTQLEPWRGPEQPRRAAVSAFGFGGTNAHVILEQAPSTSTKFAGDGESVQAYVLPLSARSATALQVRASQFRALLTASPAQAALADLCYTAAVRRSHHAHRLAVRGRTAAELAHQLERDVSTSRALPAGEPRTAFVFTGQGNQYPEMLAELAARLPVFGLQVEAIATEIQGVAGWSLLDRLSSGSQAAEVVQLSIFALQVGLAGVWREWGISAEAVVGHSLGEVAAAHVAGILDLQAAVRLLLHRAEVTETVRDTGKMLAVALDEAAARHFLRDHPTIDIAAVNSPHSTVLAGKEDEITLLAECLRGEGVRVQMLRGGYPFHSRLMERASRVMGDELVWLDPAQGRVTFYSTVVGGRVAGPGLNADYWRRNLRGTVRFVDAISALLANGYNQFIEIGPQAVLSADITACAAGTSDGVVVVPGLRRRQDSLDCLHAGLSTLYSAGSSINWRAFYAAPGTVVDLPAYPWQRTRYWVKEAKAQSCDAPPARQQAENLRLQLQVLPLEQRQLRLTTYIIERIADVLSSTDHDAIHPDTPLDAVGLDSLMVVELRNQLETSLEIVVPLPVLLSSPTAAQLGLHLSLALEPVVTTALSAEQAANLLERVHDLTEAEMDAALNALLEKSTAGADQ